MCSVMRDRGRGGSEAQAHPSRPTPGLLAVWEHHRTWPLGALCPTYSTSVHPSLLSVSPDPPPCHQQDKEKQVTPSDVAVNTPQLCFPLRW